MTGTLVLTAKTAEASRCQALAVAGRLDPAPTRPRRSPPLQATRGSRSRRRCVFALLGGLILNLMPCVFPSSRSRRWVSRGSPTTTAGHRRDGVAYTAGVLSRSPPWAPLPSRSAPASARWAGASSSNRPSCGCWSATFLRHRPEPVGRVRVRRPFAGVGKALTATRGTTDAFFTGVLAVVVASPCTAPFMGASLGFALCQPAPQTLAVLLAFGLGPLALSRPHPRCRPWSADAAAGPVDGPSAPVPCLPDVRHGRLADLGTGPADRHRWRGLALLGMILIAFSHLAAVARSARGTRCPVGALGLAAAAVLLAFGAALSSITARPRDVSFRWPDGRCELRPLGARAPDRVDQAVAAGRPVFVDFTAAWCVTCQLNERITLETPAVLRDFESAGVVELKRDWTRRDPAITCGVDATGPRRRAGVRGLAPGTERPDDPAAGTHRVDDPVRSVIDPAGQAFEGKHSPIILRPPFVELCRRHRMLPAIALAAAPAVGQAAPDLHRRRQRGPDRSLTDLTGKYVVIERTNQDCPYVSKHYNSRQHAGPAARGRRQGRGVADLSLVGDRPGGLCHGRASQRDDARPRRSAGRRAARSAKQDRARLRRHGDAAHVHHRCQRPPWSTKAASIRFHWPTIADIAKAKQYVRVGLDEVLAGKPVSDLSTRPYGCSLKYPRTSS